MAVSACSWGLFAVHSHPKRKQVDTVCEKEKPHQQENKGTYPLGK